ncbi:MAG: protease inhibitor I42 family protein [Oculatellaceae cyanobacterium bins.114]|nr:protease inhibitor I42 family protein [Oculatellaceae cyanobacterium bins.114]
MSELTLTQHDQGKTFYVKVGDTILIHLSENSTTGYVWSIDPIPESIIELQDSAVSKQSSLWIGSRGERLLTFQTKQPGFATIHFKLSRPWKDSSEPRQQFGITIQVCL